MNFKKIGVLFLSALVLNFMFNATDVDAQKKKVDLKKITLPKKTATTKSSSKSTGNFKLPNNYKTVTIFGDSLASQSQAVALLKASNPNPRLTCSIDEIVKIYWEEAGKEGVRADLAFSQALVETGFFKYGGDVKHTQNNFCGLAATGGGVKGASFKTARIGARAHIQHLLAYGGKKPKTAIVNPRYQTAFNIRKERGFIHNWSGLNGTWAMGSNYSEKIFDVQQRMLEQENKDVSFRDIIKAERAEKKRNKKEVETPETTSVIDKAIEEGAEKNLSTEPVERVRGNEA